MNTTYLLSSLAGLKRRLVIYFAAAVAAILLGCGLYYRNYRASVLADSEKLLSSVFHFKRDQIAFWRQDRLKDADSLLDSPILSLYLERLAGNPGDRELADLLKKRFEAFIRYNAYKSAVLADQSGRIYVNAGGRIKVLCPEALRLIAEIGAAGRPIMGNLTLGPGDDSPHIEIAARASSGKKAPRLYLVLVADPNDYLYPMLRKWPSSGESGESLLVKVENGGALAMSDLRHQPGSALKFRLPLDGPRRAAFDRLTRTGSGFFSWRDYRGKEVLIYGGLVPDTDWALLVKMDRDEVFSPARSVTLLLAVLVLALLGLAGGAAYMLLYRQTAQLYKDLDGARKEADAQRLNFEKLADLANDMFMLADPEGPELVYANRKALETYGYSLDEMLRGGPAIVVVPEKLDTFRRRMAEMAAGGSGTYETFHRRKDGSVFPVEVSVSGVELGGRKYVYFIGRDITARKQAEAQIKESERRLKTVLERLPGMAYRSEFGPAGRITFASPGCFALTGYKPEELTAPGGPGFPGLLTEEDNERIFRAIRESVERRQPYSLEHKIRLRNGDMRDAFSQGSGVWDEDGNLLFLEGLITDVTELKEKEREIARQAALLTLTGEIGLIGGWEFCPETGEGVRTPEVYRMYGVDPSSRPDERTLAAFYSPESRARLKEAMEKCAADGQAFDLEAEITTAQGAKKWLRILGRAVPGKSGPVTLHGTTQDISRLKRSEAVNAARLHLMQFAVGHSLDELLEEALNEAERLSGSSIGFYHFVEEEKGTLTLQNWSRRTKAEFCRADGKGRHYAIDKAGVWTDCLHARKPVIHNDYASLPHRKGLPPGHAPVQRELAVPVLRGGKIAAIMGVGNKPGDYVQSDVEVVTLLAELAWEIAERKRAEAALAENEERFRAIYESVSDAVLLIDGGLCVEANARAVAMFGCASREELLGATLMDFSPAAQPDGRDSREAGEAHAGAVLRDGEAKFYWRHRTKAGAPVDADVTLTIVPLRGKKYILAVMRDITESRRTQEKLAATEKAVRHKLDVILSPEADVSALDLADLIDSEKVQSMMDKFYRLTKIGIGIIDMKGRVLVGTGWQEICTKFHRVHPEACRKCLESDLRLSSGVPPGTFRQYKCRNGMWDIATPIMLGGTQVGNIFLGQFLYDDERPDYDAFRRQAAEYGFDERAYLAALDAVPRWSRETVDAAMNFYAAFADTFGHLSYSNIKLANALEERNKAQQALERSAGDLREKNAQLEDFIYTISHDLRSPLVNIQGFSDSLSRDFSEIASLLGGAAPGAEERLRDLVGRKVPESFGFVTSGTMRMDALIKAMLKVARQGREELSVAAVDMEAMLHAVLGSMKFQLEEAGAEVRLEKLPPCRGDESQLAQVFSNLLDNAVKYRHPERGLVIRISGESQGAKNVYTVSDNGRGLSRQEAEVKIWRLFYRARPEDGVKGEGIGLTVSRRIVQKHGGSMTAAPGEGGGAVFRIELPAIQGGKDDGI